MSKPLPPIMSTTALEDADIPKPEPIIGDFLDRRSKIALFGSSKCCKSWCLLDMAYSIAEEKVNGWLGLPVQHAKVLYINFELDPYWCRERLRAIAKAHGVESIRSANLDVWNLRGASRNYAELNALIKERVKTGHYSLVIIDPFYKYSSSGKVENAAEDMAAVMNSMEELAVDLNFAIAFAHHCPKGDVSERDIVDRGSGSGVFGRDPDAIISLSKVKGSPDEFVAEFVVRNYPPKDALGLRFKHPIFVLDASIAAGGVGVPTRDENALLRLLPASGYRAKDWEAAAKEKLDMSHSTFIRRKGDLHMKDLVEVVDGVWVPLVVGRVGPLKVQNPSAPTGCSQNGEK